jgi:hypothetical protein
LFLEDIEEIVRIFREGAPGEDDLDHVDRDAKVELKLEIGEKVCDDVQDLPKIRKRTNDLSIEVQRGYAYRVSMHVANHGSSWFWSGVTDEMAWQTFRRLQGVFNARKLRWRVLIHSIPLEAPLFAGVLWPVMGPLIWFILRGVVSNNSAVVSSLLLTSILTISFLRARFRHTTVILRHSSERAAIREDTAGLFCGTKTKSYLS